MNFSNLVNLRSNVFLALILFEMFFLQPVLGGHSVLSGHLAIPRGWPLNTRSTVYIFYYWDFY